MNGLCFCARLQMHPTRTSRVDPANSLLRRFPEQKKILVDMLVGNVFQPGADEVIGRIERMVALPA